VESVAVAKVGRRRQLLAVRRGLAPATVANAGEELLTVALSRPELLDARCVALYLSVAPEPDTAPLIDWLRTAGVRVLLPVLHDDNDLGWGSAESGLHPGRLGLIQPVVDLGPDAIAAADLVICPALAVDLSGVRLGRGGGSYDRALARVPTGVPTWVAVYDSEVVEALPHDPHDHPVTAALTPVRFIPLASLREPA